MTKKFLNLIVILAMGATVMSCNDQSKKANTSDAKPAKTSDSDSHKYIVNVAESTIKWKGFKPTATHFGEIALEKGVFHTNGDLLDSGNFEIDMTSINVQDIEGDDKSNLEAHLKGTVEGKEGDFFNINAFPSSSFEITEVQSMEAGKTMLSGNLTMKGVSNNITFPVNIKSEGDNHLSLTSEPFTIDRTKWGINFGSKSIFDNLGDKFVNDEIELEIILKAKKS